jgi:hypothetical protein
MKTPFLDVNGGMTPSGLTPNLNKSVRTPNYM